MDLTRIVTVVGLMLPSIRAATVPVDQTLMFKEIDALLRRCPCVPINTCYSQGVSLNEQNFLNTNFQCQDRTYNHCCGPYFQTLGGDDFYLDDDGFDRQGPWRKAPSISDSNIMIMLPPDRTTPSPETLTKVVLVYPETTTRPTTTTEADDEVTTVEPTMTTDEVETTLMDEETTEPVVTTTSTTEPTTTTTKPVKKTTLSSQQQRVARLQNRPAYPTQELHRVRSTRPPKTTTSTTTTTTTTTTEAPTTTTTEAPTTRKHLPRKELFKPDLEHRRAMNRLRLFVKTSTTPSSVELAIEDAEADDDEDYDDDENMNGEPAMNDLQNMNDGGEDDDGGEEL